jgi:hypothetical protein
VGNPALNVFRCECEDNIRRDFIEIKYEGMD